MNEHMIRYYNFVPNTRVFGLDDRPRAMFWVQGCPHEPKCKGCMSQQTWDFAGGKEISVETVAEWVKHAPGIAGIVLSGGEVFAQPKAVLALLKKLKETAQTDLDVMVYTGYTLQELVDKNEDAIHEILTNYVDILIDGRYVDRLNDGTCALRGSSNQKIWLLSDRYTENDLEASLERKEKKPRKVEVHYFEGSLVLVGIPEKRELEQIKTFFSRTRKEEA